jgi:hypothetical protein
MKLMTMKQFLQNPSGSYSASFARRDLIIANLEDRFYKLYKKRKSDFKVKIFRGTNKNDYFFYIQVPSEKYDKINYDVVIQFLPVDMNSLSSTTIDKYAIKVFSNSLNFTFTYCYWYNQDDIVVTQLKDKFSPKALKDKPVVKNNEGIYGFEKSCYFAMLYIKYNELNKKVNINKALDTTMTIQKLKPTIKSANSKIIEYNMTKKANGDENKKKKQTLTNQPFKL